LALVFRSHALQRMFQRGVSVKEVAVALAVGEDIEDYPADTPHPSRLVLGWVGSRPLHLVVADNMMELETIVITVYQPDPTL